MDSEALEIHSRIIIHIDIDCFYAQVEMIENPSLYNKPLGIKQKNIIVTCNYPARKRGVTKLMKVVDAQRICPELVMVLGEDLTKYREMSQHIHSLFKTKTNLVEKLGMDENFLDVTELVKNRLAETNLNELKLVGSVFNEEIDEESCTCGCRERLLLGSVIAQEIRDALKSKLQITSCAGIAHNKLLAKLISGFHKPNRQTTIFPENVMVFMETLKSPRNIPGIGLEMEKKLSSVNINTIQDLQNCKLSDLYFVKNSLDFKKLSFGIDHSPVMPSERVKQIGIEDSFSKCDSLTECQLKMDTMIIKLCHRIIDDGRIPEAMTVIVRKKSLLTNFVKRESVQTAVKLSIMRNLNEENISEVKDKLLGIAIPLFLKLVGPKFEINLIGITMNKLKEKEFRKCLITNFFTKGTQMFNLDSVTQSTPVIKEDSPQTSSSPPNNSILNYFQCQSHYKALNVSSSVKRPSEYLTESLKRSKVDEKSTELNDIDSFVLPEHVDKKTFNELPQEIQLELLREWRTVQRGNKITS